MTYTARTRDRYRRALAAITGLTTVGALTACGWLAGTASRDYGADQRVKDAARQQAQRRALVEWQRQRDAWRAAQTGRAARVRTVWKKRPEIRVVETQVVHVGTGGTLGSSAGATYSGSSSSGGSSGGSSSGGSGGGSGGGHQAAPHSAPPPPPPPKPAPSSGS